VVLVKNVPEFSYNVRANAKQFYLLLYSIALKTLLL